jgi:hypothetical protein
MRIGMGAVGAAGAVGVDGAAGERSDTSAPLGAVANLGNGRPSEARSVKSGRPPKFTGHLRAEVLERLRRSEETQADIARTLNLSKATVSRLTHRARGSAPTRPRI